MSSTQAFFKKELVRGIKKRLKPSEFSSVMSEVQASKPRDDFEYTDRLRGAVTKLNPKMAGALFDNDYKSRSEVVKGPYLKGGRNK